MTIMTMAKEPETTTEKSIQKNPNWENLSLWQKFTNLFRGRVGRKHYVIGLLFVPALFVSIGVVLVPLSVSISTGFGSVRFLPFEGFLATLLSWILLLIYFIFQLSLYIRRLHDLGASGWRLLLFLIPVVNFLFFLWLLFSSGEKGENEYGKRPERAGLFDILLNHF